MEIKIRRLENNMMTLGAGIIAFSVWSLLKYAMTFFSDLSYTEELVGAARAVFIAIIVFVSLADVLLHLYIGVSARSEGKGKKKTPLYLILTAAVILVYVVAIVLEVYLLFTSENYFTMVVTLLVDVTSVIIFIELFVSGVQLRRIRRLNTQKEATA